MANVTKLEQENDVAPIDQGAAMVSMIERVAMDPALPIDRLERLLDMKERIEDRAREDRALEARKAFFGALAEAQEEIPVVLKNQANKQTSSRYADLAAIEAQAMPVARRKGFSVMGAPVPGAADGFQRVRLTVAHQDGHSEIFEDDFPLDNKGPQGTVNKTALHAKGSTITYGRRYLLCAAFNIATSDDDGNAGGTQETVSAEQYVALRDKLEESGMDPLRFYRAFGHHDPKNADLQQFPAKMYDEAMRRIEAYMAKKGGS